MEAIRESIPVLDGVGFVQYVSHMGDDLTVANAARVSFNKESEEFGVRDEKLIQYLAKHNVEDVSKWETLDQAYYESIHKAINCYNLLIDQGIAPEQARFVLPQGTYTEWWWTGSLAAYARVYKLRSDPHAQWEVQQYANSISSLIEPLFPISWKALADK